MMTGWELLRSRLVETDVIETICVRLNDRFGEVPVADAEFWLSQMPMFTSYEDEGWDGLPSPDRGADYSFQVWTAERIFFTDIVDGITVLRIIPRTPAQWLFVRSRTEQELSEIGTGQTWSYGKPKESEDE